MLILLASASRPRYEGDIWRTMSSPIGSTLGLRYDRDHFGSGSRERLLVGEQALLAFVDHAPVMCPLVPLRFAKISRVERLGTTVWIELELEEFVAGELENFASKMSRLTNGATPRMVGNVISGSHVLWAPARSFEGLKLVRTRNIGDWERLCRFLANYEPFRTSPIFGVVVALQRSPGEPTNEEIARIPRILQPSTDYVLKAYMQDMRAGSIEDQEKLEFPLAVRVLSGGDLYSTEEQALDSRYDFKEWSFRTRDSAFLAEALGIAIEFHAARVDLGLVIASRKIKLRSQCAIAGFAFGLSPAIAAMQNPQIGGFAALGLFLTSAIAGFMLALLALSGVKPVKP